MQESISVRAYGTRGKLAFADRRASYNLSVGLREARFPGEPERTAASPVAGISLLLYARGESM